MTRTASQIQAPTEQSDGILFNPYEEINPYEVLDVSSRYTSYATIHPTTIGSYCTLETRKCLRSVVIGNVAKFLLDIYSVKSRNMTVEFLSYYYLFIFEIASYRLKFDNAFILIDSGKISGHFEK